jgi:hypothetical protein
MKISSRVKCVLACTRNAPNSACLGQKNGMHLTYKRNAPNNESKEVFSSTIGLGTCHVATETNSAKNTLTTSYIIRNRYVCHPRLLLTPSSLSLSLFYLWPPFHSLRCTIDRTVRVRYCTAAMWCMHFICTVEPL